MAIEINTVNYRITEGSLSSTTSGSGTSGIKGDPGKSAYELAVENGFTGTVQEWLASLKGESGNPGNTPIKGVDYWTDSDKAEIVDDVMDTLPSGDNTQY